MGCRGSVSRGVVVVVMLWSVGGGGGMRAGVGCVGGGSVEGVLGVVSVGASLFGVAGCSSCGWACPCSVPSTLGPSRILLHVRSALAW